MARNAIEGDRHGDFDALPVERQETIMRASIEGFGRHDYKGASTEEHVRTLDYLMERAVDWVVDDEFRAIDDFFDLLEYAGAQKLALMGRWPWVFEFSLRAFYADHRDIRETVAKWMTRQVDILYDQFMANVDFTRFRDGVDPREVLDMLIMMGDGYLHQHLSSREPIDVAAFQAAYHQWCAIMRHWAYKPEYLDGGGGDRKHTS